MNADPETNRARWLACTAEDLSRDFGASRRPQHIWVYSWIVSTELQRRCSPTAGAGEGEAPNQAKTIERDRSGRS